MFCILGLIPAMHFLIVYGWRRLVDENSFYWMLIMAAVRIDIQCSNAELFIFSYICSAPFYMPLARQSASSRANSTSGQVFLMSIFAFDAHKFYFQFQVCYLLPISGFYSTNWLNF